MAAGDLVDAGDVALDAWTPYTPTWTTATGTTPTLGNGTLAGRSRITGKTGMVNLILTWGSTTSAVSAGNWAFSLPFVPRASGLLAVWIDDNSASQRWGGVCRIIAAASSGDNMRFTIPTSSGLSGNATPMVWATGDVLILHGTLEIA